MTTNQKNKKLAVGYVRSASAGQSKNGVQTQIENIKKFASENGYALTHIYSDEGCSGMTIIRPDMDQLRLTSRKDKWSTVIVTDRDRLSRKLFHYKLIEDEFNQSGIKIMAINDSGIEFIDDMKMVFSECEDLKRANKNKSAKLVNN